MTPKQSKTTSTTPRYDEHPSSPSSTQVSLESAWPALNHVFLLLLGWRIFNAFTVRTFFQPDEYYQALEPAWQLAFGKDRGAWITWEWKNHLRSSVHPMLFALAYQTADAISSLAIPLLNLDPTVGSRLLLAAPKALQAVIAALGDYYTVELAGKVYGQGTPPTTLTLLLTVLSPWQWFVSVRSFSNCLETTLTIIALYHWPFHWSIHDAGERTERDNNGLRLEKGGREGRGDRKQGLDETTKLRRALLVAAVATVIRPTNVMIWVSLASVTFIRRFSRMCSSDEALLFAREVVLCGGVILALTTLLDRLFYDVWTFPPLNFLHVNVIQSMAGFYGNNDWHYYLSQGYPLLLITALPFTLVGQFQILRQSASVACLPVESRHTLRGLITISLCLPAALSLISHKEVRFIYPVLPALHIISALPLSKFVGSETRGQKTSSESRTFSPSRISPKRSLLLSLLVTCNVGIALYTSTIHNSGLIALPEYLQQQFETHYLGPSFVSTPTASASASASASGAANSVVDLAPTHYRQKNLTFAILMPCHSTPWRSHLQYPPTFNTPGISGWALTCEPPLHIQNATEKSSYLDEADIFYMNPTAWLKKNMALRLPSTAASPSPSPPALASSSLPSSASSSKRTPAEADVDVDVGARIGVHADPLSATDSKVKRLWDRVPFTFFDDVDTDRNWDRDDRLWLHEGEGGQLELTLDQQRRDRLNAKGDEEGKGNEEATGTGTVTGKGKERVQIRRRRRPWPDYIAFFAQLEPTMQTALRGSAYRECKRVFNSHWHDDQRRTGDVVVWCLPPPSHRLFVQREEGA